jgi:hypothetical protein
VLRNDVDSHRLPSELERVCESCLVHCLSSNGNEKSLPNDVDAHPLPSQLACLKTKYISSFWNLTLKRMVCGCTRLSCAHNIAGESWESLC